MSGAEVMATVLEELQELKGGVKDELLTWSLTSPRMKAQVGTERTMSWVLKMSVKPGSKPRGGVAIGGERYKAHI